MCQKLIGVFLAKTGCAMSKKESNKTKKEPKRRLFLVIFLYFFPGRNDAFLSILLLLQLERYPFEEHFSKTLMVSCTPKKK